MTRDEAIRELRAAHYLPLGVSAAIPLGNVPGAGILLQMRELNFDLEKYHRMLTALRSLDAVVSSRLEREMVWLIWRIPSWFTSQLGRLVENERLSVQSARMFDREIRSEVYRILGSPVSDLDDVRIGGEHTGCR